MTNLFKHNTVTSGNHGVRAERPRSVTAWNTQIVFMEVFVFCILGAGGASKWGRNKPKSQEATEVVCQAVCWCFYICLFTSPLLTLSSIDHSAEDFLPVCPELWQQQPLDSAERMACQGQSYALISVPGLTAGLTPVTFTFETSSHSVRFFFLPHFLLFVTPLRRPTVYDL